MIGTHGLKRGLGQLLESWQSIGHFVLIWVDSVHGQSYISSPDNPEPNVACLSTEAIAGTSGTPDRLYLTSVIFRCGKPKGLRRKCVKVQAHRCHGRVDPVKRFFRNRHHSCATTEVPHYPACRPTSKGPRT